MRRHDPQQLIYQGAGRPVVRDPKGEPLRQAGLGSCAFCRGDARLRVKDRLSSNYVVAKQLTLGSKGLCVPCGFALLTVLGEHDDATARNRPTKITLLSNT